MVFLRIMGRWMAIDFGTQRTGLAVTDPLRIIASPLDTVPTAKVLEYISRYIATEKVELFLLGLPTNWDGSDTHATQPVQRFREKLANHCPGIPIEWVDERNTSKEAARALVASGMRKKKRQEKGMLDMISATLILQTYMENHAA